MFCTINAVLLKLMLKVEKKTQILTKYLLVNEKYAYNTLITKFWRLAIDGPSKLLTVNVFLWQYIFVILHMSFLERKIFWIILCLMS